MLLYIVIFAAVIGAASFAMKYILGAGVLPILAFALIGALAITPATVSLGTKIAVDDATTFHEYYNGYETRAFSESRRCDRDSGCSNTYSCDPYTVTVTKTRSVSDGNGGTRTETYTDTETRYHSCPYSKEETSFYVDSTLDTFTVASHVMTGDAWRYGRSIPGGKQGAPAFWTAAKSRIDSGNPGPVTQVNNYKNFILSSSQSLFEKYSGMIDSYKSAGLLPAPVSGVKNIYDANKLYVAGNVKVSNLDELTSDLSYLNGAVGEDLHGDLHVVLAPEDVSGGADDYSNTLLAYWQSEELKRDAISKNAIIVVLGIDDKETVSWARAATGMPVGNEALISQIANDMKGVSLSDDVFGHPTYNIKSEKIVHTTGHLENLLWGDNAFERVSMTSGDSDDVGGGFNYLKDEIEPSFGAYALMGLVNIMLLGLLGYGAISFSQKMTSTSNLPSRI